MLRQNRSEGSSTSRSFAKTALLRARRKTFQFSDEQFARHIFFTEPLFLIPSVQTEVQESGPRCHTFFEGTTFPHARPRPIVPGLPEKASRSGRRESLHVSLRGNHFSSFLSVEIDIQRNRGSPGIFAIFSREPLFLLPSGQDWRARSKKADRDRRTFFAGTTFPHSVGFTDARVAAISLQQFFL